MINCADLQLFNQIVFHTRPCKDKSIFRIYSKHYIIYLCIEFKCFLLKMRNAQFQGDCPVAGEYPKKVDSISHGFRIQPDGF
jgi:hypothetical protein